MSAAGAWEDAARAAALLAVDPIGLHGISLRAGAGPVRERWLALLRHLLPEGTPIRRAPAGIDDDRLIGGLDLAATLKAGRPVIGRGLLAEADGGLVILAMAERLPGPVAGRIAAVLDGREVRLEREGLAARIETHIGIVALDEGAAEDERPPYALLDRLGFLVDLTSVSIRETADPGMDGRAIAAARALVPRVEIADEGLAALCGAAASVGVASLRAPLLALRAARAAAALAGRAIVEESDLTEAFRLVLAPRARFFPPDAVEEEREEPPAPEDEPDRPEPDEPPPEPEDASADAREDEEPPSAEALEAMLIAAARAALPPETLARLLAARAGERAGRGRGAESGRARPGTRGRPAGVRAGAPKRGARLDLVSTLRVAAPWQPLRRRGRDSGETTGGAPRVLVTKDDFRVCVRKPVSRRTTIFAVDASGSAALSRLAEAKGAVELMLAEAYVRRDRVALLAFRGREAELLLEPTRSLARAKRGLAALPGGGATPLAAGIAAAATLAETLARRGESPAIVILTDGRANIARDGEPGRERARDDALSAARGVRALGTPALLVDIARTSQPLAREVAQAMGAAYLALPICNAASLSAAVSAALPPAR